MNKSDLKRRVCETISAHAAEIIKVAETIAHEPELGFKEIKTAEKVDAVMQRHGISHTGGHAVTGIIAQLEGRSSRRNVAVLGEMDAITCFEHPYADPITGAAHACGHNAQIAAMLGCGIGLKESGVMNDLDGVVSLFAVPAEEYVEIEYRNKLRAEGKISYLGGKAELIRLGAFDKVDMAMMMHLATGGDGSRTMAVGGTSNGFIGKMVRYSGKEAHAAGAPDQGINALNAAMLALMAVHAQRETFRDEDHVRFHPIITKGGDLVNVIPADVRMESYVRARTLEAMLDANKKVNRALSAGAMAVGAEVEITDLPGYLPLINNPEMTAMFSQNAVSLLGEAAVETLGHHAASTDMGDVAHIMPVIHPWIGGVTGNAHARNFQVVDPEMAYVVSAKCMAMTVIDLLADNAAGAEMVLKDYKPKMTKQQYIEFMESIGK